MYSIGHIGSIGNLVQGSAKSITVASSGTVMQVTDEDSDDDLVAGTTTTTMHVQAPVIQGFTAGNNKRTATTHMQANVIQGVTFGNNNNSTTTFTTYGEGVPAHSQNKVVVTGFSGFSGTTAVNKSTVAVNTVSGDVEPAKIVVKFDSKFEDVEVRGDVRADEVCVHTETGAVRVRSGCEVGKLVITAGVKRVIVEKDVEMKDVVVTTTSGEVVFESVPSDEMLVKTVFGNITVPRGVKAKSAFSRDGTVDVELGEDTKVRLVSESGNISYA